MATRKAKTKAPARKTRVPTKPVTEGASSNARSKKVASPSFASVVRATMSELHPAYRFLDTTGGSGPLVRFERPSKSVVEHVVFQKGLHGASWFRVNLFPSFAGPGAMGEREHTLNDGTSLGPDVYWKDSAELQAALRDACARLEAKAKTFFGPFEKNASRYTKLFGALPGHYTAWMKAVGDKLPSEQFRGETKIEAFDSFFQWLGAKKLTTGLPGDLETSMWRFWHEARPMRESDYDKDDYYYCTRCPAFVRRARAKLVKHPVKGFGTHYALVCGKH